MSRNGSGTYTLPAGNPVVTGTTISSTWANTTMQNIADALTQSVATDGQSAMSGNLKMGNKQINNLADGSASTDAATVGQLLAFIEAGTAMLFAQTAAPTGWTKSTTHNNKALRIVSGTASSGGSVAFTTAFASQSVAGTVGDTTLTTAQIPSHTHDIVRDTGGFIGENTGTTQFCSSVFQRVAADANAIRWVNTPTGGGGSHTHSFTGTAINLAVQYVDVIISTKD